MKHKFFHGQILIEILVAVTIFAFLAVSIYGLISITRKTSRMSIQKMQAQNLVQEGVEKVRSIRDYNLKNNREYDENLKPGVPYITDGSYKVTNFDADTFQLESGVNDDLGNGFIRNITVDNDSGTLIVTVEVTWNNSAEKAVTYLTNWKN